MKASHKLERLSVAFDDPNLIANAGLILTATLARRLGLRRLVDERVDLSGRVGGANTGVKAMTVISALLAGAEWIDDVDVLRSGASDAVCDHEVRAPSTIGTWLGTWLRAFTWGHVCQLEAAAGDALVAAWAAGAGPRSGEAVTIDLDSTHCETYGLGKAGGHKVDPTARAATTRWWRWSTATTRWPRPACARARPTTPAARPASPLRPSVGCGELVWTGRCACAPTRGFTAGR